MVDIMPVIKLYLSLKLESLTRPAISYMKISVGIYLALGCRPTLIMFFWRHINIINMSTQLGLLICFIAFGTTNMSNIIWEYQNVQYQLVISICSLSVRTINISYKYNISWDFKYFIQKPNFKLSKFQIKH